MALIDGAVVKLGGLLSATVIRQWMSTLDYRVAYYDPSVDPARHDCEGQKIYIFWHENILFPIYLRGHCNLVVLLSQHRDANILVRVAHHLGHHCVRGSTYRGATSAIRTLLRCRDSMNLTITPDGPRGPRRRLAQGSIYLASKLGLPLVAMGFGYDRPWRLSSWDQFAIPRPFSRARAVVSPELSIPSDLDRTEMDSHRQRVEGLLNLLTNEAEAWAESGTRKVDEMPLKSQTAPLWRGLTHPSCPSRGPLPASRAA